MQFFFYIIEYIVDGKLPKCGEHDSSAIVACPLESDKNNLKLKYWCYKYNRIKD